MDNDKQSMIVDLAKQVRDKELPEPQRREALKLIASLRNESAQIVDSIPTEDLAGIASAVTTFGQLGFSDLTLADALETLESARASRGVERRKW